MVRNKLRTLRWVISYLPYVLLAASEIETGDLIQPLNKSLDHSQLRVTFRRVDSRLRPLSGLFPEGFMCPARWAVDTHTYLGDSSYGQEVQDRVVAW